MENQTIDQKYFTTKKYFWLILCIALVLLSIYIVSLTVNEIRAGKYIGRDLAAQNTITVTGSGYVYYVPDLAVINFSVVSEGKTVAEGLKDNTIKMNGIIEAIKKLGVDAKDLQTTGFSINPRYSYQKVMSNQPSPLPLNMPASDARKIADSSIINEGNVLVGYDITQSLTVKIRALEKVSEVIDAATNAGANQVGDLQFTIDKPEELQNNAKAEAIKEAKKKAQELSDQIGIKLGKIVNFYENNYGPLSYDYSAKGTGESGISSQAPLPQVEPGQSKIEANVSIVYEIK